MYSYVGLFIVFQPFPVTPVSGKGPIRLLLPSGFYYVTSFISWVFNPVLADLGLRCGLVMSLRRLN